MTLIRFAKTQPPAVGVSIPTDCGAVSSRWAPEFEIISWRCMEEVLTARLSLVCASEQLPSPSPRQSPKSSSATFPSYFPL